MKLTTSVTDAGCNGDSGHSTKCGVCCQPDYVNRDCCGVLCAYNTCVHG